MMPVERIAQAGTNDVSINFGGCQIGVPQHGLDASKIGASLEKVRRESVAKNVRRKVIENARLLSVQANAFPEALARDGPPARSHKKVR